MLRGGSPARRFSCDACASGAKEALAPASPCSTMWGADSGFLALAALVGLAGAYKLNVPKVLLPFSRDKRVPFLLGAEGGCYTW